MVTRFLVIELNFNIYEHVLIEAAIYVSLNGSTATVRLSRYAQIKRLEGGVRIIMGHPSGLEAQLKYSRDFYSLWVAIGKSAAVWVEAERALRREWKDCLSRNPEPDLLIEEYKCGIRTIFG